MKDKIANWLAWSPVAAVAWAALSLGVVASAGSLKGCDWSPAPPTPARPDWIPDNPPPPPQPEPNPMGKPDWQWVPFDASSPLYGWEAYQAKIGDETVMKLVRRRTQ